MASQAPVPLETLHPRVGGDLWGSFRPTPPHSPPQNKLQNLQFSNTASLPRIAQRKGGVLWEAVPNRGALHSSRVQLCTPKFRGAPRT